MLVKWHILFGFTISYILIQFFNFSIFAGLIIFLSSVLIDTDHYIYYVITMKDWNPINAVKWYLEAIPKWHSKSKKQRNQFKRGIFIFHGIEAWIILFLLSYIHPIFMWILIGIVIHMVADIPDAIYRKEPLCNKILSCYVIKRNKNKKDIREL